MAISGCVTHPTVVADATSCVDLVPAGWKVATPGAPLPADDTVGAWERFSDAQTGQLDKANSEKVEGFALIARCQARDAAAIAKARKRTFF